MKLVMIYHHPYPDTDDREYEATAVLNGHAVNAFGQTREEAAGSLMLLYQSHLGLRFQDREE